MEKGAGVAGKAGAAKTGSLAVCRVLVLDAGFQWSIRESWHVVRRGGHCKQWLYAPICIANKCQGHMTSYPHECHLTSYL